MNDPPVCAEAERDDWLRPLVRRSAEEFLAAFGSERVEALILTGSLSRGEGSVIADGDGWRLLGDIEMLVILRAPFDWSAARRECAELSETLTSRVGAGRIDSIEYGPASVDYLEKRIQPCVFAYDLLEHGRVLHGPEATLERAARFDPREIPGADALELVMNRLLELDLAPEGRPKLSGGYAIAKVLLDLAGSVLAFSGRYATPYAERAERLEELLRERASLASLLPDAAGLVAAVHRAAECKLVPEREGIEALVDRPGQRAVLDWGRAIWGWEMRSLTGLASADTAGLVEAYLSRPSWPERLKGWAKFWTHPLRPRRRPSPWRALRLMQRSSPRALTYGAALLEISSRAEGRPEWRGLAAELLLESPGEGALAHEIGEQWRWFIRNN